MSHAMADRFSDSAPNHQVPPALPVPLIENLTALFHRLTTVHCTHCICLTTTMYINLQNSFEFIYCLSTNYFIPTGGYPGFPHTHTHTFMAAQTYFERPLFIFVFHPSTHQFAVGHWPHCHIKSSDATKLLLNC